MSRVSLCLTTAGSCKIVYPSRLDGHPCAVTIPCPWAASLCGWNWGCWPSLGDHEHGLAVFQRLNTHEMRISASSHLAHWDSLSTASRAILGKSATEPGSQISVFPSGNCTGYKRINRNELRVVRAQGSQLFSTQEQSVKIIEIWTNNWKAHLREQFLDQWAIQNDCLAMPCPSLLAPILFLAGLCRTI